MTNVLGFFCIVSLVVSPLQDPPIDVIVDGPKAVIGKPEQGILFDWGILDYALIAPDTMVISDSRTPAVYIITTSGALISQIGREGMGPGEYLNPQTVLVQNSRIILEDQRLNRISIYHIDGKFDRSIPINGGPRSIAAIGDTIITGTIRQSAALVLASISGAFEPEVLIAYNDPIFGGRDVSRNPIQLASKGSKAYCLFLYENVLISMDFSKPGPLFELIEPSGYTVEQRKQEGLELFRRMSPEARESARFSVFYRYMSILPSDHLLIETNLPNDDGIYSRWPRGVILDPATGMEMPIRLKPAIPTTFHLRYLPGGTLTWTDLEEMQVMLYDVPNEILELNGDLDISGHDASSWLLWLLVGSIGGVAILVWLIFLFRRRHILETRAP